MTRVTTTRPINLAQLDADVGGGITGMDTVGAVSTVIALDTITQSQLQAAVDAHVAIDEQGNRATLEQRGTQALADNKTFLALASPTNAQVVAQVKALTRQNQALIRLVLGLLDGTD